MTWLDWGIIAYAVFGALSGFWRGFVAILFQFASLILALLLTFQLFPRFGGWLDNSLHLPAAYSQPISLAIIFFALLFIFKFLSGLIQRMFTPFLKANPINRAGGAIVGAADSLIITSIVLALLITLPTPANIKTTIQNARFSKPLIAFAFKLDRVLGKWGHASGVNLGFQTAKGDSTSVPLNFTDTNPKEDIESEIKLAGLLHALRQKNDKPTLKPNLQLQEVAKAHAKDMLARNYFGHVSPEGDDAGKRITKATINATIVGENLAHAPTLELAQAGLVASPGHLKNMLNADFNSVGIAVYDVGGNGKIVVEVFAFIP